MNYNDLLSGEDEAEALMLLSHLTEPGDKVVGVMVQRYGAYGALETLFNVTDNALLPEHLSAAKRVRPRLQGLPSMADVAARAADRGIHFITKLDAEWPVGLKSLGIAAPLGLWVRGSLPTGTYVAMVGARAATSYGEHVAHTMASDLVAAGDYVIVSGLAFGIDGAAHRAAIMAGGKTVAFMAGGLDRAYPAGHAHLFDSIPHHGAVVSEVPPGSAPTKHRFLERNRLIAAASVGVVVVEAGLRSGSLNTASHAATLRRHLMAVPGPVTSVASTGCHRIIQEMGGRLVTSADDVKGVIR